MLHVGLNLAASGHVLAILDQRPESIFHSSSCCFSLAVHCTHEFLLISLVSNEQSQLPIYLSCRHQVYKKGQHLQLNQTLAWTVENELNDWNCRLWISQVAPIRSNGSKRLASMWTGSIFSFFLFFFWQYGPNSISLATTASPVRRGDQRLRGMLYRNGPFLPLRTCSAGYWKPGFR